MSELLKHRNEHGGPESRCWACVDEPWLEPLENWSTVPMSEPGTWCRQCSNNVYEVDEVLCEQCIVQREGGAE